jgi:excisionase family DNA binding protein
LKRNLAKVISCRKCGERMVKNGHRGGRKDNRKNGRQEWICKNGHRTIHPIEQLTEPVIYRTVKEVAFLLEVHANTVLNLINSQKLKATLVRHQFHIQREDIEVFMEKSSNWGGQPEEQIKVVGKSGKVKKIKEDKGENM